MKAPRKIRLNTDELGAPDELRPALEQLFSSINPFFNDTSQALDRRLTLGSNLVSTYKEVTVTVPAVSWTSVPAATGTARDGSFENSWVNYGSPASDAGWRIDDTGRVYLRGLIKNGTIGQRVFTLQTGYKPEAYLHYTVPSNGAFGQLDIEADGDVIANIGNNAWFTLDEISFTATSPAAPAAFSGTGWPITLTPSFSSQYQIKSVLLLQATDTATGNTNPHGASALPNWRRGGKGQAIVDRVSGLTPGRTYKLLFLLLGEQTTIR